MPVDTSESVTEILNASQVSDVWALAVVGVAVLALLAVTVLYRALGGPTIPRLIAWIRWRREGCPEPVSLEDQVLEVVIPVVRASQEDLTREVLDEVKARADETNKIVHARADATDTRLNSVVEELASVRAVQTNHRKAISNAHDKATEAQSEVRKVRLLATPGSGPH